MKQHIRVLVAKPGLDGHDRGAKVVARACRDAGMEVIYSGLHCSPEQIAEAAIQEDVDVIGLSILSGAHNALVPRIVSLIKAQGIDDMVYIVGGIIPQADIPRLKEQGVHGVFGPMTNLVQITDFMREKVNEKRNQGGRINDDSRTNP